VIASQKTDGMTPDLYQQLLRLLESSIIIREYTQVYMKANATHSGTAYVSILLFLSF
jgi:hypothetical protein